MECPENMVLSRDALAGVQINVVDVTLRDGLQAASVSMTMDEKLQVAYLLETAGVNFIQAGFAGTDTETAAIVRKRVHEPQVSLLLHGFDAQAEEQLAEAAGARVDVIEIVVRSGARQLAAMNCTPKQAIARATQLSTAAQELFPQVWFCPSFATEAHQDVLDEMLTAVAETGVHHFNIPDSRGISTPADIAMIVKRYAATPGWNLGVHCHNDFGLAVANTLAGVEAGASYVDVTVNGYGERAGNCALEQIAVGLSHLLNVRTTLDHSRLCSVSQKVAIMAGRTVSPDAAVVGRDVFAQKIDAHLKLTDRDPSLLEPFDPSLVGNQRRMAIGPGSGPYALRRRLEELGEDELDERAIELLVPKVARLVEKTKGIADGALIALYAASRDELD